MSYVADLPSNRDGFAGLLGRTENLIDIWEQTGSVDRNNGSTVLKFADISIPVFNCSNADGVGPGIIRPWMGATRIVESGLAVEDTPTIKADLQLGVFAFQSRYKLLALSISHFRKSRQGGIQGKSVYVGRPISLNNNFGANMIVEKYQSLTARALLKDNEKVINTDIVVESEHNDTFELPLNIGNVSYRKDPAYFLGFTCLLAADRRTRKVMNTILA
jgi:hypothetical protein